MSSFLLYILKSTLCISILYLVFRTLMRKETFFLLNRILLLTVIACSTVIPLLYLPPIIQPALEVKLMPVFTEIADPANEVLPLVVNSLVSVSLPIVKSEKPIVLSALQLLVYLYFAGMMISLLILISSLVSVIILIRNAQVKQMDGFRLLVIDKEISAFSFGPFVIISQSDYDAHAQAILAHEQAHIRLNHFYDLMLLEVVNIFHWFNPVIYRLVRDMKEIHEFQADDYTLNTGIDATKYQLLIIQKCVGHQKFALANSFNHCQIKNRITMMNKQKTSKAWRWKVATFLPLLALLLMAFGKTGEIMPLESHSSMVNLIQEKTTAKDTTTQIKEKVYNISEILPEFTGGQKALNKFVSEKLQYPEEAKVKGIQGKVYVYFIVTSEGKLVEPKVIRGVAPLLDAEALRLIGLMPNWTPGKQGGKPVSVSYTMPLNFVLSPGPSDKAKEKENIAYPPPPPPPLPPPPPPPPPTR